MRLYYFMGKSASGKDTIYQRLMADKDLQLSPLVPYTTRPIRTGEVEGKDYHFTDLEGLARLEAEGKVVERRTYQTMHGEWNYFTVDNLDYAADISYAGIGTPESYEKILDYFGKDVCRPIYITVDDGERLFRALQRERKQTSPKYKELCRRFLADDADFREEVLTQLAIEKRFTNDVLDTCVEEIKNYILQEEEK